MPSVSKVDQNEPYLNKATKKVTFRATVSSSELDLVEVKVSGFIGKNEVEGIFNLVAMNKNTYNKPDLDVAEQTLSNGVVVTVDPHPHNSSNTECIVDFVFDFGSIAKGKVKSYDLEITAKDVRDGYSTITII